MFELDTHAHAFLSRYIERIDETAHSQHIARDILEDIKYSIIEKLYSYKTPISEAQVMHLAKEIGEPEDIFDTDTTKTTEDSDETSRLQQRFGKEKPMIRWVCYWIAKSLNISVSLVRLITIIVVFVYGISIWMYPLLALFVPYKDKKASSGSIGGLFFEVIRVIFWLGVIFTLLGLLIGESIGAIGLLFSPLISNQSLLSLIPWYLYPITVLTIAAVVTLLIWSLWALLKKSWVSTKIALLAIAMLIIGGISGIATVYQKAMNVIQQEPIIQTQSLSDVVIDTNNTLNLTISGYNNQFSRFNKGFNSMFYSLEIIGTDASTASAQVETSIRIINSENKDQIIQSLANVQMSQSWNSLNLTLPETLFTEKVPFSIVQRKLIISVPHQATVIFNNNSDIRSDYLDYSRKETQTDWAYRFTCKDYKQLTYHKDSDSRRCTATTKEKLEQTYDMNDEEIDYEDNSMSEDKIITTYKWLSVEQATEYAKTNNQLFRIVEQDGQPLPATKDYRPWRINATVYKNIITDIDIE